MTLFRIALCITNAPTPRCELKLRVTMFAHPADDFSSTLCFIVSFFDEVLIADVVVRPGRKAQRRRGSTCFEKSRLLYDACLVQNFEVSSAAKAASSLQRKVAIA